MPRGPEGPEVKNGIKMALRVFSTIPQKPLVRFQMGWSAAAMAQTELLGLTSVLWREQLWRSLTLVTSVPLHQHKPSASYKQVTS